MCLIDDLVDYEDFDDFELEFCLNGEIVLEILERTVGFLLKFWNGG